MLRPALPAFFVTLAACAPSYVGHPIRGRIVDGQSGEAIAGAVVVSETLLTAGRGSQVLGRLHVAETDTDESGRFEIPGWGPLAAIEGAPDPASPVITIYKHGYRLDRRYNLSKPKPANPPEVFSDWDGRDLELEPAPGAETRDALGAARPLLRVGDDECAWMATPRIVAALQAARAQSGLIPVEDEWASLREKCIEVRATPAPYSRPPGKPN